LKIDVLVAPPAGSARAAKRVTNAIPIVFIGEPDPVGTTLVNSLAHPGGNVTGLADAHSDLVPKRLELLKQVVPSASRVAILWNPAQSEHHSTGDAARAPLRGLGLQLSGSFTARWRFPLQMTWLLSGPAPTSPAASSLLSIFATRERSVSGARGTYRVRLRHGVSRVTSSQRYTLAA
jgi:hypothetical protein